MISILNICQDHSFLSVILLAKRILEIICIIVPIILILMSSIEVSKIVLNPDPKVVKGTTARIIHKMIGGVAVFFVPTLVSLLLNMVGTSDYKATECWTNADTIKIEAYKAAYEAEKEAEKEQISSEKKQADEERKRIETIREEIRKENENKSSALAAKLISIAEEQYNLHPGDSPNKYTYALGKINGYPNDGYGYPWCATFVWWCSKEAGVYPTKVSLKSAGVDAYIAHFRNTDGLRYEKSKAHGGNYTPKMGDYIFFSDSHSQSDGTHIGLVKGVSGDKVLIIDGNCANTVCNRSKYLNDKYIIGYGVWE